MGSTQGDARPLAGMVVLDLTRVLAGPFATLNLAQLGATVIKVEVPGTGDDSRHFPPFKDEISLYYSSLNYDKKSIALDLRKPEDRTIFDRLLAKVDVLVENFRPGTMDKLGYGFEAVHAKHPALIYASVSGYGHHGPMASQPAYDMVVQAQGGIMSITGEKDGDPVRVGVSIGDLGAGLYTVIAIQCAWIKKLQGAKGARIDISMLDCQVALLEGALTNYLALGRVAVPLGSRHGSIAPFQSFATKDSRMIIAGGNDRLFAQICESIGAPELASDPRFLTNTLRIQHVEAMAVALEAKLREKTTAEWVELLRRAGVPCAPIQNVGQVAQDEQVLARNMIVSMQHPRFGEFRTAGSPVKMTGMPEKPQHQPPPELDQDRQWILDWLQK